MYPYFPDIIEPILTQLQPRCILEIGAEAGRTTQLLLAFSQHHGARVHAIDPKPKFDLAQFKSKFGDHLVFHQDLSLDVLPKLDPFDAVLIDGDHNWYTVYHELKAIDKICADQDRSMPLIFLHDLDWPYARRDLYYDPDTIPEEFRHPYQRGGVHPKSDQLLASGGFNPNLLHATHSGGPKNGVLTAVEDYLKETNQQFALVRIPGFHTLGILAPAALLQENEALAEFLGHWTRQPHVLRYLQRVENARLSLALGGR